MRAPSSSPATGGLDDGVQAEAEQGSRARGDSGRHGNSALSGHVGKRQPGQRAGQPRLAQPWRGADDNDY
jgi:hypothetical protein